MSFETQCLICDSQVEEGRHGNLITVETGLRGRIEKILCRSLEQSPRCCSLCLGCEQNIDTIEEYYRHVEHFQKTYASTAAKYGESVIAKSPSPLEEEAGGEVGGMPSWTFCLQTSDGSLVPIQQSAPGMVVADDNQVVMETVTVESCETNQAQIDEGRECDEDIRGVGGEDGGPTDSSLLDHTGMAISQQVTEAEETEADLKEMEEPIPPKPCFACAHCGTRFDDADNLLIHERASGHSGIYNYKCGICGNIYARLDSLRDHMCRHTGQKPHKCEVCGEGFSFRNQLSRHRASHYRQEGNQLLTAASEENLHSSISIKVQDGSNTNNVVSISRELAQDIENILGSSETVELVQAPTGEMKLVQTSTNIVNECPKCKEAFTSHFGLQRHQCPFYKQDLRLQEENTYQCPKCQCLFTRRVGLERHRCPALYIEGFQARDTPQIAEDIEARSPSKLVSHTDNDEDSTGSNNKAGGQGSSGESSDIIIQVTAEELGEGSQESSCQEAEALPLAQCAVEEEEDGSDSSWRCSTCMSMFPTAQQLGQHLLACVSQSLNEESLTLEEEEEKEVIEEQPPQDMGEHISPHVSGEATSGESEKVNTEESSDLKLAEVPDFLYEASKTFTKEEGLGDDKLENELSRKESEEGESSYSETPPRKTVEETAVRRSCRSAGKVNPILERLKKRKQTPKAEASPKEEKQAQSPDTNLPKNDIFETPKRKRGRPRRTRSPVQVAEGGAVIKEASPSTEPPQKRKRGRPRKYGVNVETEGRRDVEWKESRDGESNSPLLGKRKRGRPRKITPEVTAQEPVDTDNVGEAERDVEEGMESTESEVKKEIVRPKETAKEQDDKIEDEVLLKDEEGSKENQDLPNRRTRSQPKKYHDHVLEAADMNSDDDLEKAYGPSDEVTPGKDPTSEEGVDGAEQSLLNIRTRSSKGKEEFSCKVCVRSFSCAAALRKHESSAIHLRGKNTPDNRKFVCNICGRGFMKLDHLRDHSVNHTGELPHSCIVCNKKFKFRSQLAVHRTSAHSREEIDESFKANPLARFRRRYKNSHLPPDGDREDPKYKPEILEPLEEGGETLYRCKICNTLFTELRLFNRHVISHFKVKPFKCDICSKEFARADTLRCHKKVHYGYEVPTESGLFLCDTCGRQFKRVDALRSHVKMHYGQRPWKCKDCGKAFVDRHTLGRHEVIHQTQKPFLCATCGRGFNRRTHLEVHEAQHAGIHLHKCDICDRTFNEQGNLQRHMIVHSDARPWPCPICGERFKRKGNLDEHQLTHSKERLAVCDVCGARFNTKRYLRIHQLIHSGDRPHKCPVCNATFRQLSALITHKRIHTGHAPYKCTSCDKRFKYYDQWKAHEYSHTDAKPYKCVMCNATYRQAGSLRQHRKMAHGNQKLGMLFLCSVCNKTFSTTVSLERHMKRMHDARATLQSIPTVGEQVSISQQNQITENPAVSAVSSLETSNIVHITNPQGGLETIELANITDENGATTNFVQLLNGQTLTTLNTDQVAMTPQGSVQFTDGQRFVQLVGSLGDGNQVIDISGSTGQVISIDGLTTSCDQSVSNPEDGVLQYDPNAQHTVVQLTDAQAFVEAVSQMEAPSTDGQVHHVQEVDSTTSEVSNKTIQIQNIDSEQEASLPCVVKVDMSSDMQAMSGMSHQIVSNASLVPIEIVPVETTVTTMEPDVHGQLSVMETVETSDTMHVITDGTHPDDIMTDDVTQGVPEQEVVETVSIATTSYEHVSSV